MLARRATRAARTALIAFIALAARATRINFRNLPTRTRLLMCTISSLLRLEVRAVTPQWALRKAPHTHKRIGDLVQLVNNNPMPSYFFRNYVDICDVISRIRLGLDAGRGPVSYFRRV